LLLAVAAIVLAVIWYRTRERRVLHGLAATVGLLTLLLVVDGLIHMFGPKSVHDQIVAKLEEMAAGVKAHDLERTFQHVADNFELGYTTKSSLKQFTNAAIENGELSAVEVWNFEPAQVTPAKDDKPATAKIRFRVKPKGAGTGDKFFDCEAVFVKEQDGQWRLLTFQIFQPGTTNQVPIPQLPN
jgi:hypothetical protein